MSGILLSSPHTWVACGVHEDSFVRWLVRCCRMKNKKQQEAKETLKELEHFKHLLQPPTATKPSAVQIRAQEILRQQQEEEAANAAAAATAGADGADDSA